MSHSPNLEMSDPAGKGAHASSVVAELTEEEEFWTNVDVREMRDCWRWRESESYGVFARNGQSDPAHRFAWKCTYGDIPKGLLVLHGCDNSWCVNPRHLRLGTVEDNARDRAVLSRARQAIESARRKRERKPPALPAKHAVQTTFGLTVRGLRKLKGWSLERLAVELNTTKSSISKWENGIGGTALDNLPRIAAVLGCSVTDLLNPDPIDTQSKPASEPRTHSTLAGADRGMP